MLTAKQNGLYVQFEMLTIVSKGKSIMTITRVNQIIDKDTAILRDNITELNWCPSRIRQDVVMRIAKRIMKFAILHNVQVQEIVRTYA